MSQQPAAASTPPAAATRKYVVHFADGRSMICIDLAGDPPEAVERGIREQFFRYEIARIEGAGLPPPATPPGPRVLNVKTDGQPNGSVFIGRPSKWGNPFVIGKDGDRAEVIAKYRQWLLERPELVEQARQELAGRALVCFCAPQACHGDVLLEVANP